MRIEFVVNDAPCSVDVDVDTPLLWALREELNLTGTKFGCGRAQCGACTVHVDGVAVRSCAIPAAAAAGGRIVTIEGLAATPEGKLQQAWIDEQVSQCGYCQSGMLMAAAALLKATPKPSDRDIDSALTNLCRCGTYPRVKRAIKRAAGLAGSSP
jgi:isoquinoline 1-oxidoreductase alpha subunit